MSSFPGLFLSSSIKVTEATSFKADQAFNVEGSIVTSPFIKDASACDVVEVMSYMAAFITYFKVTDHYSYAVVLLKVGTYPS